MISVADVLEARTFRRISVAFEPIATILCITPRLSGGFEGLHKEQKRSDERQRWYPNFRLRRASGVSLLPFIRSILFFVRPPSPEWGRGSRRMTVIGSKATEIRQNVAASRTCMISVVVKLFTQPDAPTPLPLSFLASPTNVHVATQLVFPLIWIKRCYKIEEYSSREPKQNLIK